MTLDLAYICLCWAAQIEETYPLALKSDSFPLYSPVNMVNKLVTLPYNCIFTSEYTAQVELFIKIIKKNMYKIRIK